MRGGGSSAEAPVADIPVDAGGVAATGRRSLCSRHPIDLLGRFVRILDHLPTRHFGGALCAAALLGCAPPNNKGRFVMSWPGMRRACGSLSFWLAGIALRTAGGRASRCSTATTTPALWI